MKKIVIVVLGMVLGMTLFLGNAYAQEEVQGAHEKPINIGIQEVQAHSLDDSENEKPKKKGHTKKAKKNKKAKKSSN